MQNTPHRNRRLFDGLLNELIVDSFPMLKDFHVPPKYSAAPAVYFDNHQVAAELVNPRRTVDESLQLARSIHVENKNSIGIEMPDNAPESFLPVGKSLQVIDRVEGTDDGVEPAVEVKAGYVLSENADIRQSLTGDGDHGLRAVEAGDIVGLGQTAQHAASAASDFQECLCARMVMLDETANVVRRRRPIAHDLVVEP